MKKQKQKRIFTRRQSALRVTGIALAVVVFVVHVMHLGLIFPVQTVWQMEERAGIKHTRVVKRSPAPEIHKTHLAFLSENDDATLFSSCHLTIYGWMANFHVAVDCTGEEPLCAGVSYMSRDENRAWYFFGRVDDPAIQRVEISLCETEPNKMGYVHLVGDEVHRMAGIPLEEQSGRRYFLAKYNGEWDYDVHSQVHPIVIGYDGDGQELIRMEIEHGNSSSFG